MRLSLADANRASIVLLAALLAGCSNTTPGSQALPLGGPDAIQSFARHHDGSRTPQCSSLMSPTMARTTFPLTA